MTVQQLSYRGKRFAVPQLSTADGITITGRADAWTGPAPDFDEPVLADLNSVFDLAGFGHPRRPVSLGPVPEPDRAEFQRTGVAPRVLDMPIRFPGSQFLVPREFGQFAPVIQRIADYEALVNPDCYDEYYCYLTVDQGVVRPSTLQREAPCHVDGFQGARWQPKVRINHTYTVSDALPTNFYVQPFATDHLDEAVHDFFWDFNRQVAETNSAHVWQGEDWEILLMDAYCVHRGVPAAVEVQRTWVRLSFEVRAFDRLGNGHNPLFRYDWPMVPRDIEMLGLRAWDADGDPSLRVFPWQRVDGGENQPGVKTTPNLRPHGS